MKIVYAVLIANATLASMNVHAALTANCFCLDVCSREMNEGNNQAQVISDEHIMVELLKFVNCK